MIRLQIALSHAGFSPGIIDGRLGRNTVGALHWFQVSRGLPASDVPDAATIARLGNLPPEPFRRYMITASDVAGPFDKIPKSVYKQKKLKCLCYESPAEEIGERFHTSPGLLARINPRVDLRRLDAGMEILVPAVQPTEIPPRSVALSRGAPPSRSSGEVVQASASTPSTAIPNPQNAGGERVDRVVISRSGFYLLTLAPGGAILNYYPSTLGSKFDPSPQEVLTVTKVTLNPWFQYQPALFADVPDWKPEARLPPGPNSPVGVAWIDLSKEHYGIHGTPEPQSIGYTTSHGCVRLTNWDVIDLAGRISRGTPVEFR